MNELWLTFSVLGIVAMLFATWYDKKAGAVSAMIAIPATLVLFTMEVLSVKNGNWVYRNSVEILGIPIELIIMYFAGSFLLVFSIYVLSRSSIGRRDDYRTSQSIFIGFSIFYLFLGVVWGIFSIPYFWAITTGSAAIGLFLGSVRKTAVFIAALSAFAIEAVLDRLFIQNGAYSIQYWDYTTPICFLFGAMLIGSLITQKSLCQKKSRICVVR
jgi:hypothetical protein